MQFKHPEILFALFLLAVPIIVHLFQLRRFKKQAFTNVAFLNEIVLQTRKSAILKKWLTLMTRLLLFAAIILAFSQPFTGFNNSFKSKKETVIVLDNTLSMQAKGKNGTLYQEAVNELIGKMDNEPISLLLTDEVFANTTIQSIRNELLQRTPNAFKMNLNNALLRAINVFAKDENSLKNLMVISDFQQMSDSLRTDLTKNIRTQWVQLKPLSFDNLSIDSVYVSKTSPETQELTVSLANSGTLAKDVSVSLYNGGVVFAKTTTDIEQTAKIAFSVPNNTYFNGRLQLDDNQLQFDNQLFFNLDNPQKINVLCISETNDNFLQRIFREDEFNYKKYTLKNLDYNQLDSQHVIVINGLQFVPESLINSLMEFRSKGGSVLIIPNTNSDLSNLNLVLSSLGLPNFTQKNNREKRITTIDIDHSLYKNVFTEKINNFQYPSVRSYFSTAANHLSPLSFEDGAPFLLAQNNCFAFTADIQLENSNFIQTALIVPTLYNIGKQSLKLPQLYYTVGCGEDIEIKAQLAQDEIISLSKDGENYIPQQQVLAEKVRFNPVNLPLSAGIYSVMEQDKTLGHISFNHTRAERALDYMDMEQLGLTPLSSVGKAIDEVKSSTEINTLWKVFVIFALVFLLIEMLILKFLK